MGKETTLNFGLLMFRNQKVWLFVYILIRTRKNTPSNKINKYLTFLKLEFSLKDYFILFLKKLSWIILSVKLKSEFSFKPCFFGGSYFQMSSQSLCVCNCILVLEVLRVIKDEMKLGKRSLVFRNSFKKFCLE